MTCKVKVHSFSVFFHLGDIIACWFLCIKFYLQNVQHSVVFFRHLCNLCRDNVIVIKSFDLLADLKWMCQLNPLVAKHQVAS